MSRTGDYLIPRLNGEPFLEKPPLYYAMAASIGSLAKSPSEMPYRMASLIFSTLSILITFFMVSRQNGRIIGLLAAGILAGSWEFFQISRWILVDISLVFGVTLSMFAYLEIQKTAALRYPLLLGLGLGLSFLTKGFVGPAMVFAAVLADLVRTRDLRVLLKIRPHLVLAIMLGTIVPWVVYLYADGGWPFVREVIVVNNLMRFTGAPEGAALGHQHGILFYLERFPRDFLPWTFLFIPALISSFRTYRDNPYMSWFIGPFVLLCLASTKRGIYLVPLFPAAAAITACWLSSIPKHKWEVSSIRLTWAIAIAACFLPLAGIYFGKWLLSILAFIPSLAVFFLLIRKRAWSELNAIHVVPVMLIGLFASATVYFEVMKPSQDYLGFTREAVSLAQRKEIHVMKDDELFEGIVPMVTGKPCKEIDPGGNLESGLYLWVSKEGRRDPIVLKSSTHILLEKKINRKRAILASITRIDNGVFTHPSNIPVP
ncbi:MAG: phospholipid carrier-dependent glycosyltransferase [Syntrophorhabdus aromaticivorans]|uniref:Phospholipid carrier-dependent glycosyltransferase n=1 Tax=Syntrophorhabdus aromaticivorans TaxID=328301 RepID=A0A971M6Q9_9BACT|nr:phospholipid carrier-dependent glycosyltransferase [Syntrophorhabdus aromaticivorans]